jgi:flagellar basal-body rod protein FlgB
MNLFDITQTGLERAISGAAMRQSTLSSNIANANTPGYRRRDVDFHSSLREAMAGGHGALERVSFSAQTDPGARLRTDGNGVDVDVEAANLARNGLDYESLVSVARTRNDILRSAMGVG